MKELGAILLRLDIGFCRPYIIKLREVEGKEESKSVMSQFEVHCWPSKEAHWVWSLYVQFECTETESLNALWLAAQTFKANTAWYLKKAGEKQKSKASETPASEMSNINVSSIRGRNRNIVSYREE